MTARRLTALLVVAAILPALFIGATSAMGRLSPKPNPFMVYVAHACGGFEGMIHTSAEEAMEKSYSEGYRLFELDVEFTSDNHVVLVHDWGTFAQFAELHHWPTFEEYTHLPMKVHFKAPTMERLQAFLKAHPDTFIIIDSKRAHVTFLEFIAKEYPSILPQAMPYIYAENEYEPVRALGYRNMIFASYASRISDDEIISIVERHPFFAVAVPVGREYTPQARMFEGRWRLPEELQARGVKLFIHVVNDRPDVELARKRGITGILSDWLIPDREDIRRTAQELPRWRKHPV